MNRKDFVVFLRAFRKDLIENKKDWENHTLESFLEAMIGYTADVQGYYNNKNLNIDADDPTWDNFKTIMEGASVYE